MERQKRLEEQAMQSDYALGVLALKEKPVDFCWKPRCRNSESTLAIFPLFDKDKFTKDFRDKMISDFEILILPIYHNENVSKDDMEVAEDEANKICDRMAGMEKTDGRFKGGVGVSLCKDGVARLLGNDHAEYLSDESVDLIIQCA